MRNDLSFALLALGLLFASESSTSGGETKAGQRDDYANDPYWYKPGHPVNPADATAIQTRPGFRAERILSVPRDLGSWTALCVDWRGRLIAAAQDRAGLFRITVPAPDAAGAETKVEPLRGAAEKIGWSHGLLYAFDSLYVTVAEKNEVAAAGVYRLQDTDGDDQFDRSTLLFRLDGTGEHGPHNIVVSPDGRSLFMMCGNGTKVPADLRARRPVSTTGIDHLMPPGFASSQHSTQGWVMRFDPDGGNRELICTGLRNSFDLAFNAAGDLFTFDSDAEWDLGTPWYRPTRIVHLVSGGEYGWRPDAAVWPDHFEDAVAPVLNIGPGSPTGLIFGYGAKFPAKYQNALFVCDWTFATVHAVFLRPEGASYRAEVEEFLGGAGLPVTDVIIGGDGAMYVVVGGRRLGSALYRVRYVGNDTVAPATPSVEPGTLPSAARVRRELEGYHGRVDPTAVEKVWPYLGHADRGIRFAARVALESQPVDTWRERVLTESDIAVRLTGLLALARQGSADDQAEVLRAGGELDWREFSPDRKLNGLRVIELAIARRGDVAARFETTVKLRRTLMAAFPDADSRVNRELARVLCSLGEIAIVDRVLALMARNTGEQPAQGLGTFTRNPKYGQAVRDMLEAAPLLERMHHAQMLLWLAERWTAAQRRTFFELVADAATHSKGGHSYREFWSRIRESALARSPAAEREGLAALGAARAFATEGVESVRPPKGPGREWTVEGAVELAQKITGRDFESGKAMFAAAGCAACHRVGNVGGSIGPDLSAIGQRFTVRDILEATIEPSRAISDQYRMVLLETQDGRTVSGRIVSRDERATHLAPNLMRPSQSLAIPNDAIVSEKVVPVSTMPSGLLNALNPDEVLDLLAFLLSGGDARAEAFAPSK